MGRGGSAQKPLGVPGSCPGPGISHLETALPGVGQTYLIVPINHPSHPRVLLVSLIKMRPPLGCRATNSTPPSIAQQLVGELPHVSLGPDEIVCLTAQRLPVLQLGIEDPKDPCLLDLQIGGELWVGSLPRRLACFATERRIPSVILIETGYSDGPATTRSNERRGDEDRSALRGVRLPRIVPWRSLPSAGSKFER